jgi:hypothetical protein
MSSTWGTEADTPYQIHILESDREKVISLIKEGLSEYIDVDEYFSDYSNDKYFNTFEMCNSKKMITFTTFIANLEEVISFQVDGRKANTVKVLWGIEDKDEMFLSAENLLREYT